MYLTYCKLYKKMTLKPSGTELDHGDEAVVERYLLVTAYLYMGLTLLCFYLRLCQVFLWRIILFLPFMPLDRFACPGRFCRLGSDAPCSGFGCHLGTRCRLPLPIRS